MNSYKKRGNLFPDYTERIIDGTAKNRIEKKYYGMANSYYTALSLYGHAPLLQLSRFSHSFSFQMREISPFCLFVRVKVMFHTLKYRIFCYANRIQLFGGILASLLSIYPQKTTISIDVLLDVKKISKVILRIKLIMRARQ